MLTASCVADRDAYRFRPSAQTALMLKQAVHGISGLQNGAETGQPTPWVMYSTLAEAELDGAFVHRNPPPRMLPLRGSGEPVIQVVENPHYLPDGFGGFMVAVYVTAPNWCTPCKEGDVWQVKFGGLQNTFPILDEITTGTKVTAYVRVPPLAVAKSGSRQGDEPVVPAHELVKLSDFTVMWLLVPDGNSAVVQSNCPKGVSVLVTIPENALTDEERSISFECPKPNMLVQEDGEAEVHNDIASQNTAGSSGRCCCSDSQNLETCKRFNVPQPCPRVKRLRNPQSPKKMQRTNPGPEFCWTRHCGLKEGLKRWLLSSQCWTTHHSDVCTANTPTFDFAKC